MALISPFYLMSVLYLAGAAAALVLIILGNLGVITPITGIDWLRVHFITIGAVTQALFGALPSLAAAKLGAPGQPAAVTWRQWFLLNLGFALLLVGMPGQRQAGLGVIGATVIFLAVLCLTRSLYAMWLQSPRRAGAGARFYLTAPVFFLVGITMAVSMLLQWPAPGGYMGQIEAHVHANVWGFLALVAAGTLYDLLPVLSGKPLHRPRWVPATYWLLTLGAAGLVAGPWVNSIPLTLGGLATYVLGTVLHLVNLIGTLDLKNGPLPARAMHMVVSYAWMIVPVFFAPFIVLFPGTVDGPAIEAAAVQGLVFGWVLQIALGALPVVVGYATGKRSASAVRPADVAPDAGWFSVVALNAGVAVIWVAEVLHKTLAWSDPMRIGGYVLVAAALVVAVVPLWRIFASERRDTAGVARDAGSALFAEHVS